MTSQVNAQVNTQAANTNFKLVGLVAAMGLTAMLTACGGGGGGSADSTVATGTPAGSGSVAAELGGGTTTTVTAPVTNGASTSTPVVTTPVVVAPVVEAGTLSTTITPSTYAAGSVKAFMFDQLNALRLAGGFGTLKQNDLLDKAAQAQTDYVIANYLGADGIFVSYLGDVSPTGELYGHSQFSTGKIFIGSTAIDRAKYFGYETIFAGEIGASIYSTKSALEDAKFSINSWLWSYHHRQFMLDPAFRDVGAGSAINSQATEFIAQADFLIPSTTKAQGYNKVPTGWHGVYPLVDETNVQTKGYTYSTGQAGFGVSFAIGGGLEGGRLTVESFTLSKIVGAVKQSVQVRIVTSANDSGMMNTWAIAEPSVALDSASNFEASFVGFDATGRKYSKVWRFTTQ